MAGGIIRVGPDTDLTPVAVVLAVMTTCPAVFGSIASVAFTVYTPGAALARPSAYVRMTREWEWEWTISSDKLLVCLYQPHPIRSAQGWRGLCPQWTKCLVSHDNRLDFRPNT